MWPTSGAMHPTHTHMYTPLIRTHTHTHTYALGVNIFFSAVAFACFNFFCHLPAAYFHTLSSLLPFLLQSQLPFFIPSSYPPYVTPIPSLVCLFAWLSVKWIICIVFGRIKRQMIKLSALHPTFLHFPFIHFFFLYISHHFVHFLCTFWQAKHGFAMQIGPDIV